MNLQRREEIRGLIAEITRYEELGATLDLESKARDAINELLAHIDTLEQTAAKRVIAEGSRGPTPDYTGEGSAWVPPVEARAVVVPDDDRPSREFLENYVEGFDPGERSAALFGWREGCRHLREHSRPIPAGRVLGEGQVAVDREWRDLVGQLHMTAIDFVNEADPGILRAAAPMVRAVAALRSRSSALRAQPTQEPAT